MLESLFKKPQQKQTQHVSVYIQLLSTVLIYKKKILKSPYIPQLFFLRNI